MATAARPGRSPPRGRLAVRCAAAASASAPPHRRPRGSRGDQRASGGARPGSLRRARGRRGRCSHIRGLAPPRPVLARSPPIGSPRRPPFKYGRTARPGAGPRSAPAQRAPPARAGFPGSPPPSLWAPGRPRAGWGLEPRRGGRRWGRSPRTRLSRVSAPPRPRRRELVRCVVPLRVASVPLHISVPGQLLPPWKGTCWPGRVPALPFPSSGGPRFLPAGQRRGRGAGGVPCSAR